MKLWHLTYLIIGINSAIDSGKYDDISLATINSHIENGDVFDYLQEVAGENIDISLLSPEEKAEVNTALIAIQEAYGGKEARKWGVKNRGLCLLLAWINELIQQEFIKA